eukprot:SAG31_NODE_9881_length_1216_cov_2.523724_2_plen_68_part_00
MEETILVSEQKFPIDKLHERLRRRLSSLGKDCYLLVFVELFLNLPYTHREVDCLLSRFHETDRETRD